MRNSNSNFINLPELTTPLCGWYVDLEFGPYDTLLYVFEVEPKIYLRLLGGKDLAQKMDPANYGDFVCVQFAGWKKLDNGTSMMIATVDIDHSLAISFTTQSEEKY